MAIKTMTRGHLQNIPFATTLNDELRRPDLASVTRLNASLLDGSFSKFATMHRQIPLTGDANALRDKLNKEFEGLWPTLFPKTRYRGVSSLTNEQLELVKNFNPGDVVKDEGFAYFSKYKHIAKDFAKDGNSVLVECKIPFWSKISRMLFRTIQFQEGHFVIKAGETMLPAGSSFKVLKNSIDKNGLVKLVIKYLK